MSMENKIDSRELLIDEVSESTHFSSIRARKFFTMRDAAGLIDNVSDSSWLVSRVYDGKVMYEWVVLYEDKIFRVYDWKTYDKKYTKNRLTTWSIGGNTSCDWFLQTLVAKIQAND